MRMLNQQIPEVSRKQDFITAFYGKLDYQENTFVYCNCGHSIPILLRFDGQLELLEAGGPGLNIIKDAEFSIESVNLNSEDQIIFYTDGVTEIFDKDSNEYGFERLKRVILDSKNKSASELIEAVVESTRNYSNTKLYRDDFTLVVIKRK
jgi:sigma-B regulation protein RsbU (phosphoserine phosphatase)